MRVTANTHTAIMHSCGSRLNVPVRYCVGLVVIFQLRDIQRSVHKIEEFTEHAHLQMKDASDNLYRVKVRTGAP